MLKRKYGDRSDWKRVLQKEYIQMFLDTEDFKGYVSLLKVNEVFAPLYVQYGEKRFCVVDAGYIWLQHFPADQRYSLTTMFDEKGEVIQWYIDITNRNGTENNIPFMEDLYLDIIVLPTGQVIQKDRHELEEAYSEGIIDELLYKSAIEEANRINTLIEEDRFELLRLANSHKQLLMTQNVIDGG